MAEVNGLSKERMLEIEATSIVDGAVDANGDLILTQHDGTPINAGPVIGPAHEIVIAAKAPADAPSTYPVGITTFEVATEIAGWPANYITVFSYVKNISRGWQMVTEKSTGKIWVRTIAQDAWSNFFQLAEIDSGGTLSLPKIRLSATGDASETGTGHAFQIGPDDGVNMIIDGNEMMARNNGVGKRIYMQFGAQADVNYFTPTDPSDYTTKVYVDSLVVASEIAANVDLNTVTTQGNYVQSATAEATTALNYPRAIAGLLEVTYGPAGTHIFQRYTPYGTYASEFYIRAFYGGTWYPWRRYSAAQIATGLYTGASIAASTGVLVTVNFPSGRFSAAPRVVAVPANSSRLNVAVSGVTTTSFDCRLDNFTTASAAARDFYWIAVQET